MGMLKCTRCGVEYEAELGSAKRCPDCREYGRRKQAEYSAEKRKKIEAVGGVKIKRGRPKKEVGEKKKETYYQRNRERLLQQSRDNYYKNLDKKKAYSMDYYRKNKDKIKEYQKAYRICYQAALKESHELLRQMTGEKTIPQAVEAIRKLLDDI